MASSTLFMPWDCLFVDGITLQLCMYHTRCFANSGSRLGTACSRCSWLVFLGVLLSENQKCRKLQLFLGRTKLPLSLAAIAGSLCLTGHALHSFVHQISKVFGANHDQLTNRLKVYKATFAEILANLYHML